MSLQNKVIVITGGSSGMGAETAKLALKDGAKVVLGARHEDALKKVADEADNSENVAYQVTDVTKLDQVKDLVKLAKDQFGRIDVMYNNAGIMPQGPLSDGNTESWQQMLNINIMGVLNGISASLPYFHEQGYGQVLATDSVAGHVLYQGSAVYNGTKYSVRAIMEGLRQEEHNNGIKSGIVSPGFVDTNLFSTVGDQNIKDAMKKMTSGENAILYAKDVARSVVFMMDQPGNVDINEILVRPTAQDV